MPAELWPYQPCSESGQNAPGTTVPLWLRVADAFGDGFGEGLVEVFGFTTVGFGETITLAGVGEAAGVDNGEAVTDAVADGVALAVAVAYASGCSFSEGLLAQPTTATQAAAIATAIRRCDRFAAGITAPYGDSPQPTTNCRRHDASRSPVEPANERSTIYASSRKPSLAAYSHRAGPVDDRCRSLDGREWFTASTIPLGRSRLPVHRPASSRHRVRLRCLPNCRSSRGQ